MNRHADYEIVQVDCDRVFVIDLDRGGPSVTNDAEYVRDQIAGMYPDRRLIYRDSMGQWDEIMPEGKGLFKFYNEYTPKGI